MKNYTQSFNLSLSMPLRTRYEPGLPGVGNLPTMEGISSSDQHGWLPYFTQEKYQTWAESVFRRRHNVVTLGTGEGDPARTPLQFMAYKMSCCLQNLTQFFTIRNEVKSNFSSLLGVIILLSSLFACEPDDAPPEPQGRYESGVIVINEGNFTDADGSLSFYDKDSTKVNNGIFEAENGRKLFGIVQNVRFFGEQGFIVTNSDDKIEMIDGDNFGSLKTIQDDIENPNDITVVDDVAYVSVWGVPNPDFTYAHPGVAIIDLNTSEVIKDIATNEFPGGMLAVDKQVYVAVGSSDEVLVINTETNEVSDTIHVSLGPKSFQIDQNGKIWVMCTGTFSSPAGNLVRINPSTHEIEATLPLENQSPNGKMAMNGAGDQLYYLSSIGYNPSTDAVFEFDITSTSAPANPLIEGTNMYGIGVDPETNTIYIADSNAFQGNGTVVRYNPDGSQIDSFGVGRGPSGFVFR